MIEENCIFEEEPVRPVIVHAKCKCGGEYLITADSICLTAHPPRYSHRCDRCGDIQTFSECYPCVKFKNLKDADA